MIDSMQVHRVSLEGKKGNSLPEGTLVTEVYSQ